MGDVYDLDAATAERTAGRTPFHFRWDGELYELPTEIDGIGMARIAAGDLNGGMRRLFGEEQYARLSASPKTFGDQSIDLLLTAWADHLGVKLNLGESPASSTSSSVAARPSSPTSNGSTGLPSATSEPAA